MKKQEERFLWAMLDLYGADEGGQWPQGFVQSAGPIMSCAVRIAIDLRECVPLSTGIRIAKSMLCSERYIEVEFRGNDEPRVRPTQALAALEARRREFNAEVDAEESRMNASKAGAR